MSKSKSSDQWGTRSKGLKSKRAMKMTAVAVIITLAGGAGIGTAIGYFNGARVGTDIAALSAYDLPSVPSGFVAQNALDNSSVEESLNQYDDLAKEIADILSSEFGLKFDNEVEATVNPMYSGDGKTVTDVKSINSATYTAVNQTIPNENRERLIEVVNSIVQPKGFAPFTANAPANPETNNQTSLSNELKESSLVINGQSLKNPLDQYSVQILNIEGDTPIKTVVVYFVSMLHINKADQQKFKDQVVSDYEDAF